MLRSTLPHTPTSTRSKRIGRKVLAADRLAHAVSTDAQKKPRKVWRNVFSRPKLVMTVLLCVLAVGTLGSIASQAYLAHQASVQKAEDKRQAAEQKAKAVKEDACRRAKLQQKADLIGKITYDELYDYGECDE